jgi:hypothetical protein
MKIEKEEENSQGQEGTAKGEKTTAKGRLITAKDIVINKYQSKQGQVMTTFSGYIRKLSER